MKKQNNDKSVKAKTLVGATAATIGIGGIAALVFPFAFPAVAGATATGAIISALASSPATAAATAATASAIVSINAIKNKSKSENDNSLVLERATDSVCHSEWLREAHEEAEE